MSPQEGVCSGGSARREVCPGGCLPGGVCQTVNRITVVKTLPCPNYVVDGDQSEVSAPSAG